MLGADNQQQQLLGALRHADRGARRAVAVARDSGGARSSLLPRSLRLPARARGVRARAEQRPRSRPAEQAARRARARDAGHRPDRALPAVDHDGASPVRAGGVGRLRSASPPRDRRRLGARRAAARRADGGHRRSASRRAGCPAKKPREWRDAGLFSFVPCVSNDATIAVAGGGPPAARRAAQQRGHDAARRRRRAGGDRARERAALQPAQRQGRRDRTAAPVQRQRRRVADRRPGRRRPRRPRAAVEPPDGSARRAWPRAGARPAARRRCSAARSSTRLHAARRESPSGTTLYRVPLEPDRGPRRARCSSTRRSRLSRRTKARRPAGSS